MVKSFTFAAAVALLSAPLASSHYILNIRKPHSSWLVYAEVSYTNPSYSHAQWQASRRGIQLRPKELQHLHAFVHGDHRLVSLPPTHSYRPNTRN